MRVLVAPAAFKEVLSARQAAAAIAAGLRGSAPGAEIRLLPLADGGDGTLDALWPGLARDGAKRVRRSALDLRGKRVAAPVLLSADGRTAWIESASLLGLGRVPPANRHPEQFSSRGLGLMIRKLVAQGVRRIHVGLGGTGTVDGGLGLLDALGARLRDRSGHPVPACGEGLTVLHAMDLGKARRAVRGVLLEAWCDVDTPLLGARRFVDQKGGTDAERARLKRGIANLRRVWPRSGCPEAATCPGGGAAGGLGAALFALGAKVVPGAGAVLAAVGAKGLLRWADLAITGEGRLDGTSLTGKAPVALARLARAMGKPVIALVGSVAPGTNTGLFDGVLACARKPGRPAAARARARILELARTLGNGQLIMEN